MQERFLLRPRSTANSNQAFLKIQRRVGKNFGTSMVNYGSVAPCSSLVIHLLKGNLSKIGYIAADSGAVKLHIPIGKAHGRMAEHRFGAENEHDQDRRVRC